MLRLCCLLKRTRRELGESMDAAELQWWGMAFDLGLLPDPLLQTATLVAAVLNSVGQRCRPSDFLPDLSFLVGPLDGDAELARFQARTAFMKG